MTLPPSLRGPGCRLADACGRVRSRAAALRIIWAVLLLAFGVSAPATADEPRPHVPRLRPVDRPSREVLADGYKRSATFRRLVDEIEQSNLFVYIEATREVPTAVHAFMQLAGASGRYRYMRIRVRLPASTDTLIAELGHELQHITEVSHATDVRDQPAMEALYRRIGDQNEAGWDTAAARAVGRLVLDEVRHNATTATADQPAVALQYRK